MYGVRLVRIRYGKVSVTCRCRDAEASTHSARPVRPLRPFCFLLFAVHPSIHPSSASLLFSQGTQREGCTTIHAVAGKEGCSLLALLAPVVCSFSFSFSFSYEQFMKCLLAIVQERPFKNRSGEDGQDRDTNEQRDAERRSPLRVGACASQSTSQLIPSFPSRHATPWPLPFLAHPFPSTS